MRPSLALCNPVLVSGDGMATHTRSGNWPWTSYYTCFQDV